MTSTLLTNAIIHTPDHTIDNGWLLIENSLIKQIGSNEHPSANSTIDCNGGYLLAGFIDVHVHGAIGHDVMDANIEGLLQMSAFFASKGVTSWLPTTLTASHEQTLSALSAIKQAMAQQTTGATILGAHLEGPYLNVAKCGAQDSRYIRRASQAEVDDILALDVVRLASIAPEYDENLHAIQQFSEYGVTVSAAHTNATLDQMQSGIQHGISHSTHTFNAMPPLHHREASGLTALLLDDTVTCEIIADGVHVHPQMIQLLLQTIGTDRLVLITDAMRATGMPTGTYTLGEHQVNVDETRATLADGTLAGSILTMDNALKNVLAFTGESLQALSQTTSANPAHAVGENTIGVIAPDKVANLVLLNEDYDVQKTFVNGVCVYQK